MIDVVIVNWNAGDALRACLRSLKLDSQNMIQVVTVVDNASMDA